MTATLMCQSDTAQPNTTPVTFILSGQRLVTVRYDEPRPFAIIAQQARRGHALPRSPAKSVLMDLLDAVIDRNADILERIGCRGRSGVARTIFEPETTAADTSRIPGHPQYHRPQRRPHVEGARKPGLDRPAGAVPRQRGRGHALAEGQCARNSRPCSATCTRCPTTPPISPTRSPSCSTPCSACVSIEQNNIIKLFSVVAVVLMPPTLVGIDLRHELQAHAGARLVVGYPFALVLMVVAAILPYFYFKWKKWL